MPLNFFTNISVVRHFQEEENEPGQSFIFRAEVTISINGCKSRTICEWEERSETRLW
jgi:hypothetical protein